MKYLMTLAFLLCLLVLPAAAQHTYAVGDTVADFALPNSQGDVMSLADYPDRIFFLVFWQEG